MKTIGQLTAEAFDVFVGKAFRPADADFSLTLATIDRREFPGWGAAARKPFSLILRGPRNSVLPEGFYTVTIDDGPGSEALRHPYFDRFRRSSGLPDRLQLIGERYQFRDGKIPCNAMQ